MEINGEALIAILVLVFIAFVAFSKIKGLTMREAFDELKDLIAGQNE